jgi:polysaccharide export outer membrane protein
MLLRSFASHCRAMPRLLAVALVVSACSSPAGMKPAANQLSGQSDLSRIYRAGIGDKLKIAVFGEPELSGQFEVSATGVIAMPLVGEIPAKGKTVPDLRAEIVRRLESGYLRQPKVSVEVLNYRPFFVHGEVRNGGEFQFRNGVTIRDAVAMAGGYTYRANHSYVLLIREGETAEQQVDLPSAVQVLPGDNIRIPERFF